MALLESVVVKKLYTVIVNGKTLRYDNKIVYVELGNNNSRGVNYKYFVFLNSKEKQYIDKNLDADIINIITEDYNKYSMFAIDEYDKEVSVSRDDFLSAYIINSELYLRLADSKEYGQKRFFGEYTNLINEFIIEQLINYFDVFIRISRKLTASYMSNKIKAHFVEGLFQPYIVGTQKMVCPIKWGIFENIAKPWIQDVIELESVSSSRRGLELSCVSMYDFCNGMGIPLFTQLDKRSFMCALCILCALEIDENGAKIFMNKFPEYYKLFTTTKDGEFLASLFAQRS